jgi:hypothetical protein
MSLSRMVLSRFSLLAGPVAALLLAVQPVSAQPAGSSKVWPWNVQGPRAVTPRAARLSALAPSPAPRRTAFTGPLDVTITEPASPTPLVVTLRGPGNEARTFEVPAGRKAIRTREFIVRPGEQLTIPLPPTAQVQAPPRR